MADKDLEKKELATKLKEAKTAYYAWHEAIMSGKETNYSHLKNLRKEIARILTAINEKERANT